MSRTRRGGEHISPPTWVKPQLVALVKQAPDGPGWLHEIKLDGYRMHARLDAGRVNILREAHQSGLVIRHASEMMPRPPRFEDPKR
jgi:hypothetical protein